MPYKDPEEQRTFWRKRNWTRRGLEYVDTGKRASNRRVKGDPISERLLIITRNIAKAAEEYGYAPLDVSTVPADWYTHTKCYNYEYCGYEHIQYTNVRLSLDHCHTTGRFRGMLCVKCNMHIEAIARALEGKSNRLLELILGTAERDGHPPFLTRTF